MTRKVGRWNPYFVAFAQVNGRTPAEQDAHDRATTHKMEFIIWINQRWTEYRKLRGLGRYDLPDHDDFALWLPQRAAELLP